VRWVESAAVRPGRCAVLPYIGSTNSQYGFIDTGAEMPGFDNHVYVSVLAVEQMAQMIGWQPPHAIQEVQAQLDLERTARAEAEAKAADLERKLAAVQVLKQAGYTASRKPGRPPNRQKVS
jgi:hypothetical protein